MTFECHLCHKILTTKSGLRKHLANKSCSKVRDVRVCPYCGVTATNRYSLKYHIKTKCGKDNPSALDIFDPDYCPRSTKIKSVNKAKSTVPDMSMLGMLITLSEQVKTQNEQITKLISEEGEEGALVKARNTLVGEIDKNGKPKDPKVDIVCLAKGDYVKKIVELYNGDEKKAFEFIKNIGTALDFLDADFKLVKKIYFDGRKKSEFPIRVKDLRRNKLEYMEENGKWTLDINGEIVGKRIADNIVNTMLVINNLFHQRIMDEKDPDQKEFLLDLYQTNKTQAHILQLTKKKNQIRLSRKIAEFICYCDEVQAATGNLDAVAEAY